MKKIIYGTDKAGNKIATKVKLNDDLFGKPKKKSKLKITLATTAIVLAVGTAGAIIWNRFDDKKVSAKDVKPTTSTTTSTFDESENFNEKLRFNPNTKESVIDSAVFLIEEAAAAGKELDAEDAVLASIAANANELSLGFMGELFGEKANQTYTYNSVVDSYLRVCMMQLENAGIADNDSIALNIENIFANEEDYNFLCNVRGLTTRFNNSKDEKEKAEITSQLNEIAADLCGYDLYDISSSAGIVAMLTLDGMRTVTITNDNPILPDDIRDEMFGNGDYACQKDGVYTSEGGQVLQTAYSFRVGDLKLDTLENKMNNAVLENGKTVILGEIIEEVKEKTKDVVIAEINMADKINEKAEKNRTVPYAYESSPGVEKPGYSKKEDTDKVIDVGGKDVIVVPGDDTPDEKQPEEDKKQDIVEDKKEAEDKLEEERRKAQADSDQGCKDGEYYGKNGLDKPSFAGKSQYYINAFNTNYDFWYAQYLKSKQTTTPTTEITPQVTNGESKTLDSLSKEELLELKSAAMGTDDYSIDKEEKTKTY